MLVLLPLAAALMLLARSEKQFLAGGLLGFAASFKVYPGLFGVYLICQRRWRALFGMIAVGVLCMVLLPVGVWGVRGAWEKHLSWYQNVITPYHAEGTAGVIGRPYRSTNQSLTSAVHRFLTPIRAGKGKDMRMVNVARLSPRTAERIALLLRGIIGLGLVVLWAACYRRDEAPAARAALFATVPLGMLLIGDPSLSTHHVVLLVPWAVIIGRAGALHDAACQRRLWIAAAALAICIIGALQTFRPYSPFPVATLTLLVGTIAIVISDHRAAGPAASSSCPCIP